MPSQPLIRRLTRVALWVGGSAILVYVLDLLGIPVDDWISELFDKLGEIPAWAVVAGVLLQSANTMLAATAWCSPRSSPAPPDRDRPARPPRPGFPP